MDSRNGRVLLIKPEGLYDTFETEDVDISEWFEDEEYECRTRNYGSYLGWRFRPAR